MRATPSSVSNETDRAVENRDAALETAFGLSIPTQHNPTRNSGLDIECLGRPACIFFSKSSVSLGVGLQTSERMRKGFVGLTQRIFTVLFEVQIEFGK
jgi:hypothetical protein